MAEPASSYGEGYSSDMFTLYRDFVDSAQAISERRSRANQFFLGINTVFVGGVSYAGFDDALLILISAIAGFAICLAWWGSIRSYRTLNSSKFKVIQAMEQHLPAAPYTAEEAAQAAGATRHVILSKWESWVPSIFAALHLGVGLAGWLRIKA